MGVQVMTAADLRALATEAAQDTAHYQGLTAQAELLGTVAREETYGQPATNTHLIQKLRNMDPALRDYVLVPTTTRPIHLPKERP